MSPVRKQYYFRPSDDGYDAWDVDHLIELSADLPEKEVPLTSIRELDTVHWFGADVAPTQCGSWCATWSS